MVEAFSAAGTNRREAPLSSRRLEGLLKKDSEAGECHDQMCILERTFGLKVGNRLDVGKKPCRRRCDGT